MDKIKLVEKLREKANISYEEAKSALEKNNWDILDAIVYLENNGKIESPSISVFYTNEYKESYNDNSEAENINEDKDNNNYKRKNDFEGIFEAICKAIDTCNNIIIEVRKNSRLLLKIPLTVVIVLLLFAFWIIIPLIIVGLFFDIEFSILSKQIDTYEVNKILDNISKGIKDIKEKITTNFH